MPGRALMQVPGTGGVDDLDLRHVPAKPRSHYWSAKRALDAGLSGLAAVALRNTLEAAAAHHGIKQGALFERIDALANVGLITKQFKDVFHRVRMIGNAGAHDSDEQVDEQTARKALLFTTQVLRNLFEIPAELAEVAPEDEE